MDIFMNKSRKRTPEESQVFLFIKFLFLDTLYLKCFKVLLVTPTCVKVDFD
jgi:hypothetical protein